MSSSRSARAFISTTALGIAVVVLAGCGATADQSAGDHDAVYRLPITDPGSEIDPLLGSAASALAITGLVTEPLVSLDRDGDVNPRLAEEWWPAATASPST